MSSPQFREWKVTLVIQSRLGCEPELLEQYKFSDFIEPLSHCSVKPDSIVFPRFFRFHGSLITVTGSATKVIYRVDAETEFSAMTLGLEYYKKFFVESGLTEKTAITHFDVSTEEWN
ncbi:MAG: hypothetical protein A2845_01910 [Candidatus Lloydbacteria bacterium RIFCSPHIGHO2_01_FULL_49_22]|uniref:Uncharacterized protein n=1 Tax=Candidatus Lloydbacteria bacterium RIFCSPHIGHO2_01_FULL_49_22 TaxID=1798658 RepID=A0A1G2CUG7_9BACT|nr:MAG: hypothetical protein A2845_01910 [Candidatus Lloydbacteria bacterium RIFCSPHIGHO2_01_FULL_49_22]OGZ09599.1 MAG: hypothetical protein A3C14_05885 [Candidatus Lloydbacteria bacterium RIFCSPHIGHO2_02_FULL_50_18]